VSSATQTHRRLRGWWRDSIHTLWREIRNYGEKKLIKYFKIQHTCNILMEALSNIGPMIVLFQITGNVKDVSSATHTGDFVVGAGIQYTHYGGKYEIIEKCLIQDFKIQHTCNMVMAALSNIGPMVVLFQITGNVKYVVLPHTGDFVFGAGIQYTHYGGKYEILKKF
jgi:hypothetical protein